MKKLFFLFILSCIFVSCTSGKPAANSNEKTAAAQGGSTGPVAVEITPGEAARNTTLCLTARGFNLSDATIVWLVNNKAVRGATASQFQAKDAVWRGDTVQAKAVLRDRELLSNIVTIGNALPEITALQLLPEVFKPGDTLNVAAAGADADGDTVSFLYEWTKNGAPAGNTNRLADPLKRGDKLCVSVTPYDGREYGRPRVIEREIRNTPPVITDHRDFTFDGSLCTYQVQATDPDGDALTYTVEAPPAGMTIDRSTGLLKWSVPPAFKGKQSVRIIVSDGNGGVATYDTEITIQ